jgi:hypothetical protein
MRHLFLGLTTVLAVLSSNAVFGQEPASTQKPAVGQRPGSPLPSLPFFPLVPLRLQLVISKYEGQKKISSLPYMLSVNANEPSGNATHLRMGSDVPYYTTTTPSADGKVVSGSRSYSYRPIGTNIDCGVRSTDGGQFDLEMTIEDSSIQRTPQGAVPGPDSVPTFRNFRISNHVLLKDGETTQVTAAADPVSGEVMRVDVTLTVIK